MPLVNHLLRRSLFIALLALVAITALPVAGSAQADPKDACKHGGYLELSTDGVTPFRNQGQCVSFVAHGGTPLPIAPEPVFEIELFRFEDGTCRFYAVAVNVASPGDYVWEALNNNGFGGSDTLDVTYAPHDHFNSFGIQSPGDFHQITFTDAGTGAAVLTRTYTYEALCA